TDGFRTLHPVLSSPSASSWSADLRRAEDEVPDAASFGIQLALALEPGPPGGAQIAVGSGQAVEIDVGHALAGLRRPAGLQVSAGLSLSVPYPTKHFEGVIRLTTHRYAPSGRCAVLTPDSNSCKQSPRHRIKGSLMGPRAQAESRSSLMAWPRAPMGGGGSSPPRGGRRSAPEHRCVRRMATSRRRQLPEPVDPSLVAFSR